MPDDVAAMAMPDLSLALLLDGIRMAEHKGHQEALRVCCHVAALRLRFFAQDTPGWLALLEREFKYDRRFSCMCYKVGSFVTETLLGLNVAGGPIKGFALKPSTAATLLRCDLRKLERLAEIPAEHLTRFVEGHPDVATAGRDKVYEWATAFRGLLPGASEKERKAAAELEKEKRQAVKDDLKKLPEWKLDNAAHELLKLGTRTGGVFGAVDARTAFRAGLVLHKAAADAWERGDCPLAEEDIASIEADLSAVLDFVRKLRGAPAPA